MHHDLTAGTTTSSQVSAAQEFDPDGEAEEEESMDFDGVIRMEDFRSPLDEAQPDRSRGSRPSLCVGNVPDLSSLEHHLPPSTHHRRQKQTTATRSVQAYHERSGVPPPREGDAGVPILRLCLDRGWRRV
jgi:hypothetical protein